MVLAQKRGVFFSIVAVFLSSLIVLLFSISTADTFDLESSVHTKATEYVDEFVSDIEFYVATQSRIATYSGITDLVNGFGVAGAYPSAMAALEQCLLTGSFGYATHAGLCSSSSQLRTHLVGAGQPFTLAEEEFPQLDLEVLVVDVSIVQVDSYVIEVNTTVLVNVSSPYAQWKKRVLSSQRVSLVGLPDPATVRTPYFRNITLYPSLGEVYVADVFSTNYDLIEEFSVQGYSYRDVYAPSFFAVLQGGAGSKYPAYDQFGITSIVNDSVGAVDLYENNQTPSLAHFRVYSSPVVFDSEEMSRIEFPDRGLTAQLFPQYYLVNNFKGVDDDPDEPLLWPVAGCCTDAGCSVAGPSCGP